MANKRSIVLEPITADESIEVLSAVMTKIANEVPQNEDEAEKLAFTLLNLVMISKFVQYNKAEYAEFLITLKG